MNVDVHCSTFITLDVQGTLSLTQPAGGVAGPTKNETLEYFHASGCLPRQEGLIWFEIK